MGKKVPLAAGYELRVDTINGISTVQGFPSDLALGMRGDKIAYSASVKSVTESLQDVAHAQRTNANLE